MSQHHPNSPEQALLIDELRDIQSELLDAVQRAEWLLKQSGFDGARQRARLTGYRTSSVRCRVITVTWAARW